MADYSLTSVTLDSAAETALAFLLSTANEDYIFPKADENKQTVMIAAEALSQLAISIIVPVELGARIPVLGDETMKGAVVYPALWLLQPNMVEKFNILKKRFFAYSAAMLNYSKKEEEIVSSEETAKE